MSRDPWVYRVAASNNTPVRIINGSYDGDRWRPYLPAINSNISDTRGRAWPGNPAESEGLQFVNCWNDTNVMAGVRAGGVTTAGVTTAAVTTAAVTTAGVTRARCYSRPCTGL